MAEKNERMTALAHGTRDPVIARILVDPLDGKAGDIASEIAANSGHTTTDRQAEA